MKKISKATKAIFRQFMKDNGLAFYTGNHTIAIANTTDFLAQAGDPAISDRGLSVETYHADELMRNLSTYIMVDTKRMGSQQIKCCAEDTSTGEKWHMDQLEDVIDHLNNNHPSYVKLTNCFACQLTRESKAHRVLAKAGYPSYKAYGFLRASAVRRSNTGSLDVSCELTETLHGFSGNKFCYAELQDLDVAIEEDVISKIIQLAYGSREFVDVVYFNRPVALNYQYCDSSNGCTEYLTSANIEFFINYNKEIILSGIDEGNNRVFVRISESYK